MQTQYVGVKFIGAKPWNCAESKDKIYYYKDTLKCKVGDEVVVETCYGHATAKVLVVATDTCIPQGDKHVVAKVESAYTREQARIQELEDQVRDIEKKIETEIANYYVNDPWLLAEALSKINPDVAKLLTQLNTLKAQLGLKKEQFGDNK